MEKTQLLFIPLPSIGHLISTVEMAKLLLNHHHRLSVTILIMRLFNFDPNVVYNYTHAVETDTSLSNRLKFIFLPKDDCDDLETFNFVASVQRQMPHVKQAVIDITRSESESDSPQLAGLVLDMLCTAMIDVGNDFGVPSYIFFTSSAGFLGFMLRIQEIYDEEKVGPTELMESGTELAIPCFANPFPARAMPFALLSKDWLPPLLDNFRRFKEAKGIIVNTFFELESYAVESFSNFKAKNNLIIYPVGPILSVECDGIGNCKQQEIMLWLDDQPASSVVFLCFGSMGSFSDDQVKEIAYALEHSGHRFLWSLRRPPTNKMEPPTDHYEYPNEVLPKGFLNRSVEIGKIIGRAPQAAILAHRVIGGFVSHCGWNSILESIWYGIPVAAWPIYSEQQCIAFEMVIELGLAEEIKIDYRVDGGIIVSCDEIERRIRCMMEQNSDKRKRVKEMNEKSRMALMNGGSSYMCLERLIKDVIENISKNKSI